MTCDDFFKIWVDKPELFTEPDLLKENSYGDPPMQKREHEAVCHLRECPACARKIAAFDLSLDLIRDEIEAEQSATFWHDLRAEVKKQLKPQPLWRRFFRQKPKLVWGLLPATLAALLLLTLLPFNLVTSARPENIFLLSGGIPGFEYEIEIENILNTEENPDAESIYAACDSWTALLAETI